ncbi:MAG: Error-prone repair protein ImuA [Ginsengibacter sp.]
MQGIKTLRTDNRVSLGVYSLEKSFPNGRFPLGCMHELIVNRAENASATNGFVSGIVSRLMQLSGLCVWIGTVRNIFPGALKGFGIDPDKIIFIDLKKDKDVLYATEEALKCNKVTAVIAEVKNISFKESRRFQLAAEQSRVTGFIIRNNPHSLNTIACVSRWCITSIKSDLPDGMPGVGFARWQVELLKIRNGTPGKWNIEWSANAFHEIKQNNDAMTHEELRKIG